jgi:energy-coupling factor transport system permease protein
VPLLGPMIIGSLIDVRERSLALEARGFSSGAARTAYRIVETTPRDVMVTRVALLALATLPIIAIARLTGALPG